MKVVNGFNSCFWLFVLLAATSTWGQTPGPSTNMVSGTQWPGGDPFLQRQNEPSMAVSSRNSLHVLAGANDYRTVDIPFPASVETGDAWLGLFKSYDGGATWTSTLIPGYQQDTSTAGTSSPVHGLSAAADPIVRAGTNGMMYYSGIAFNRTEGGASQVFLSRFIDDNNLQGGDTIRYLGTSTVATGTATRFLDKPSMAVDVPRLGFQMCTIPASGSGPAQSFPGGRIYVAYTSFVGGEGSNTSAIFLTQSNDCGVTWVAPIQISSASTQTNQGASLAINPNTGDLYVVWRIFSTNTAVGGIGAATILWDPLKFTLNLPATQIATFAPFDQGTTNVSFRTNDYPSVAADDHGHLYVAWSERNLVVSGDARIVTMTGNIRTNLFDVIDLLRPSFTSRAMVDPNPSLRGQQIMPVLAYSSGKLTAAWYDFRNDDAVATYSPIGGGRYSVQEIISGMPVFGPYLVDPQAPYTPTSRRQTVEVRAAQAAPAMPAVFKPSVIVSQFAFGTPSNDISGSVEQLEFDAPNLPMFEGGTVPFFGDYIDLAGPTFVPANGSWRANTLATDPDFTRVVWTDSRNVIEPSDGNWAIYTPPAIYGGTSIYNGSSRPSCDTGHTGDRNQDIFTAAITTGVVVSAKGNSKQLSSTLQREFPITVQNTTNATQSYRLSLVAQPAGGTATFLQGAAVTQLDVSIPPLSSASRSLFVTSTNATSSIQISVQQISLPGGTILPTGLASSVALNADVSNPNISNPNISNTELYNPNISNPNISNPNISNPNISNPNISNPNISNTTIANPNISNPNISNPNISNPNISNPNISNPNISNPNISNPNISNTSLADVNYTVTNTGNTSASYSLQVIESQALPNQVVVQAIASKVYTTPVASACALTVEAHYQPILNVTSLSYTDAASLGGTTITPTTPTFALDPGESALITLRFYVPNSVTGFNPLTAVTPVVSSIAANTGSTKPPLTLTITTGALPSLEATLSFSQQLQAVGGTGTGYVWTATGLPSGLSLSSSGLLQGTATTAGAYAPLITVTDSGAHSVFTTFNIVVLAAPSVTTTTLNSSLQGAPFSQQLTSTGGTAPLTWTATSLPAGLTLSTSGLLAGTPAASGSFTPKFTLMDARGASVYVTLPLLVAPVTVAPITFTSSPVAGFINNTYAATVITPVGGTPPYKITSSLPMGMNLTNYTTAANQTNITNAANASVAAGNVVVLAGYPAAAGTGIISVTDSSIPALTANTSFLILNSPTVTGTTADSYTQISSVGLNGSTGTVQITALPGAPIAVDFNYALNDAGCPGCIDQLTVGFVNTLPDTCVYNAIPGSTVQSGPGSVSLTAPSTPGRYYIAYNRTAQYVCQQSSSYPTYALEYPITTADANKFAVVDVIPSTLTYGNVTISNVSYSAVSTTANPISISLTYNNPSTVGTISFGFNTDPAWQSCGGITSGSSGAVNLITPAQQGRYYLSLDNVNTCTVTSWANGVPGSNFARIFGAIDVFIGQ